MINLKIDNKDVRTEKGTTILQAAEASDILIPSMCYLKGLDPSTSCMVCVVEVEGRQSLVPSCRVEAEKGMVIETDNKRVQSARKTALELLLSEHAGDCTAPCQKACPMHIDIPLMIRNIKKGNIEAAGKIIAEAVSGSDAKCSMQCEKACRRKQYDESVAICSLINFIKSECACSKDKKELSDDSRFNSVMKKITEEELNAFLNNVSKEARLKVQDEAAGYDRAQALKESCRCLHCDCRKQDSCKLRDNAGLFQAKQIRFAGERTPFTQLVFKDYIFEQGKCIKCGICTGISEKKGIKYGFGFLDRGFNTKVGVGFNRYENPELIGIISLLIESCPTGALAVNDGGGNEEI